MAIKARRSIINANKTKRLLLVLFFIVILQSMGAPGNFVNVIGHSVSLIWYMINNVAPIVIVLIFLITKKARIKGYYFTVVIFCVYIFFSGLLVSYFSNVVLEQSIRLTCTIIVSLYMCDVCSKEEICNLFAGSQIIISLMIIYMIVTNSSAVAVSDGYFLFNLVGLFTTKNSCGYELIFGALIFYYIFRNQGKTRGRIFWLILFLLETILAYYSRTVGALLTGIIVIILYEISKRNVKRINLANIYIAINGAFWGILLALFPAVQFIASKFGKTGTLTGRTTMWKAILEFMNGFHILFGYGYGGFWNNLEYTQSLYRVYGFFGVKSGLVGGHNLFFELYINIGIVGVILFIVMVINALKKSKDMKCSDILFEILLLSFITIRGLIERTFNSVTYDTICLFIVFGLLLNNYNYNSLQASKQMRQSLS